MSCSPRPGALAAGSGSTSPSGDLLDRRDQLISELVAFTGGNAATQDGGLVNVFSAGGQPLVVGATASTLVTVPDPYRPERLQVALETNGQRITLDKRALGGQIGGLIEFRIWKLVGFPGVIENNRNHVVASRNRRFEADPVSISDMS